MNRLQLAASVRAELNRRGKEALAVYKPLPKILTFHKAQQPVRSLLGGNRSGKTTAGAVEVAWYGRGKHPYRTVPKKAKILCVENTWSLVGDPMWQKLSNPGGLKVQGSPPILPPRVISQISWMDKAREVPERVKLLGGATIAFKPCEAGREKFEGAEYDFVWLDEELADSLVFQEILRSLVDRGGSLISTATPLARGRPLLTLHEMAGDPDAPLKVFETFISIMDNPYIDEMTKRAFIDTIPEEYIPTRVHGEFLVLEGLVYKEWKPDFHEIHDYQIPQEWPRVMVIDPGYHDPCAVLWAAQVPGKHLRYVIYREYYARGRSVSEVARDICMMTGNDPVYKILIDPASRNKGMNVTESVYDQFCKYLKKNGLRSARTGNPLLPQLADTDIRSGVYAVKELLAAGESGFPGVQITADLVHFKKELGRYAWPPEQEKRNSRELPIDKDNHLMDCLRYLAKSTPVLSIVLHEKTESERIAEKAEKERIPQSVTIGGGGW